MNTQTTARGERYALFWEEMWTAGPIAGLCLLMGLAVQLCLWASARTGGGVGWHQVDWMVMMVTLGAPLMVGLLLTLNVGNSGHLGGGFSKRILRLPVDTRSTVTISFVVRLVLVLLVSALITAACWLIFSHGPGFRAIFLVAGIYLFIQVSDWSRAVTAILAPVAVVLAVGLLLVYVGDVNAWGRLLVSGGAGWQFLAGFALWVITAYGLSLFFVAQARSGDRLFELTLPAFGLALPSHEARRATPFRSPLAAQVWFELKRSGFSFPAMVAGAWLFAIAIRFLMVYSLFDKDTETEFGPWHTHWFDPTWTVEILPFVALVLVSIAWSLHARKSHMVKGRRDGLMLRLPLYKKEMAQARLIAAGLNLSICLAVITVAAGASLLFTDNGFIAGMASESLSRHETSLRELATILVGPSLVVGLLSWFLMVSPPVNRKQLPLIIAVLAAAGVIVTTLIARSVDVHAPDWLLSLIYPVVALPTAFLIGDLLGTWRRGLITGRSIGLCLLVWAFVTAVFFPFSIVRQEFQNKIFLIMSLALGALAVSPFVSMVVAFAHRPGEPNASEKPPERSRDKGLQPLVRVFLLASLLAVAGFLIWLRWPAELAWKQSWRAQGLPVTSADLNAWYPTPPPGKNLADLYLRASVKYRRAERAWNSKEAAKPEGKTAVDEKLLIAGSAELRRAKPIPEDEWRLTSAYWENVARGICPALHEAAHSGLTESRYRIDFARGWWMDFSHLESVKALAWPLRLEALTASVERRPEAATNAILDILPLGDSLAKEPTISSAFVRLSVYAIATGALEDAMNRLVFSDGDLARIDAELSHVLPPVKDTRVMDRVMTVEEIQMVDSVWRVYVESDLAAENSLLNPFLGCGGMMLTDVTGFETLNRLAMMRQFVRIKKRTEEVARKGALEPPPLSGKYDDDDSLWKSSHLRTRMFLAAICMPALQRCYDSEWRTRTWLELARTAIAVERFRLAKGHLPERLDELVPAYIENIPNDLWHPGHNLSYRVKDNGEFVVYSYFDNFKDDQGEESLDAHKRALDMTFTVAPVDVRNQPQVAPAAGAAS